MRFYVYCLADPRDGKIFYIGKGTGRRIDAHERNVANKTERNGIKLQIIKEIWASGKTVRKRILKHFEIENDAFALERKLIRAYKPGANISQGTSRNTRRTVSLHKLFSKALRGSDVREDLYTFFPRATLPEPYKQYFDIVQLCSLKNSKDLDGKLLYGQTQRLREQRQAVS